LRIVLGLSPGIIGRAAFLALGGAKQAFKLSKNHKHFIIRHHPLNDLL